jgi:hypothetical protein
LRLLAVQHSAQHTLSARGTLGHESARLALSRLHEQREPPQRSVLSAHLDEAGLASQGRDLFAGHGAGTTHKYRTRCG